MNILKKYQIDNEESDDEQMDNPTKEKNESQVKVEQFQQNIVKNAPNTNKINNPYLMNNDSDNLGHISNNIGGNSSSLKMTTNTVAVNVKNPFEENINQESENKNKYVVYERENKEQYNYKEVLRIFY